MKIIHCADLHLDSGMQTNLTKEQAKERKSEILETFLSMVDYAVENKVSAILISGDLFDTKRVSARTKNVVREAVLGNPDIDFYYLKGNHDVSSPFNYMEDIDDTENNGRNTIPDNLKLFSGEWTTYCPAEGSRIRITGLELGEDNSASAWNTLVLDTECINIVMLHGQETESRSDRTECINLKALRNRGIDYLALGHIHAYKMEKLDSRGTYCYPGCLEGRGFDECGEHGFVLLDIDEDKNDTAGRIKKEFVPIAFRKLYTFDVDISGCMSSPEIETKIRERLSEETFEETDLIKLVLTGQVDVECEKDTDYLLKRLKTLCFYMKIEDTSEYAVDYDSFILDESLKGEFVRTVMAKEDITGEEKARIIRCGIQALRGEN